MAIIITKIHLDVYRSKPEIGSIITWDETSKLNPPRGSYNLKGDILTFFQKKNRTCWLVYEVQEKDIIHIDKDGWATFRNGIVLYAGEEAKGMIQFEYLVKTALQAYSWEVTFRTRNKDFTQLDFSSEDAFRWAYYIGDRDIMRSKITESNHALRWALNFEEDKEIMKHFITESSDALRWALDIGNRKEMLLLMNKKDTDEFFCQINKMYDNAYDNINDEND